MARPKIFIKLHVQIRSDSGGKILINNYILLINFKNKIYHQGPCL